MLCRWPAACSDTAVCAGARQTLLCQIGRTAPQLSFAGGRATFVPATWPPDPVRLLQFVQRRPHTVGMEQRQHQVGAAALRLRAAASHSADSAAADLAWFAALKGETIRL